MRNGLQKSTDASLAGVGSLNKDQGRIYRMGLFMNVLLLKEKGMCQGIATSMFVCMHMCVCIYVLCMHLNSKHFKNLIHIIQA